MKRRDEPITDPPPIDRAQVRALLEAAAADRNRGVTMHQHPALNELGDLCGVMAYYAFQFLPADHPLGNADLDELEERIVRHSVAWKSQ